MYRQVETYLDKAGFNETERSILAKNLEGLAERIKNGRINFSFTYGLHHPEVQNRGGIIKDWVEAVSKLSAEDQRTGVVGVKFDKRFFKPDSLNDLSEDMLDITDRGFLKALDGRALSQSVLCKILELTH